MRADNLVHVMRPGATADGDREPPICAAAVRFGDLEKDAQMDCFCARAGRVRAGVAAGRSCRLMLRLELLDQRPHVLAHLDLSEQDADRAVRVDEEVCT